MCHFPFAAFSFWNNLIKPGFLIFLGTILDSGEFASWFVIRGKLSWIWGKKIKQIPPAERFLWPKQKTFSYVLNIYIYIYIYIYIIYIYDI